MRFRQKSSRIIDEIVETIENELSQLITNKLNKDDIKLIHHLSHTFAKVIYEEIQAAIEHVEAIGTVGSEFTERVYSHLNTAASDTAKGLQLSKKATEQFLQNIFKDLKKLEDSGLFHIDLNNNFDRIINTVIVEVAYRATTKLDGDPIFNQLNDTLARIVSHLRHKYHNLHDFFLHVLTETSWKVRPHIENIKTLAHDFLSHVTTVSKKVAQQALEFFRSFNSQLGGTWIELKDRIHQRIEVILEHRNPYPTPEPLIQGF